MPSSGSLTLFIGRMPKAFGIRQASSGKVKVQNSWFLDFAKCSVICEHRVVLLNIVLVSLICELTLLNQ